MNSNKKILDQFKKFILTQSNTAYDDRYWLSVIKGLKYLFLLKDSIGDKNSVISAFNKIRDEIFIETNDRFIEDLVDELNAILIQYYPMPDFWNSTIWDFKKHINFKRYFDLLDKQDETAK